MAIAFVQKTAKFNSGSATSITSAAITTTLGNRIVVTVSTWIGGTNNQPTFSDSKGNTWTVDASLIDGSLGNARITIASCPLTVAGSGHTFTVTGQAGMAFEANATEFSGVGVQDQPGTGSIAASATTKTVTSGVTTQASELVVAAICINSSTAACNINDPPSGYTSIGVNQDSNTTIGYESAYKVVSSTGAQTAVWTFDSTSSGGATGIITYLGSGAPAAILEGSRRKKAAVHPGHNGPQSLGRFFRARRPNTSNPPAPDVTLALTGIGGTGAVGTVGLTHTQALTGNAATGAVGTVAPTAPNALTGNAGTGAVGTVAPTLSLGVTGNAATAAVGTVATSLSIGLTGNQATGAAGTLGGVASNAVGSRRRSMAMNPGVNPYNIAKFFKSRKNTESLPTAPIVVGLTGNQAAGSVGTVGVTHTQAQTGNAATAAVGTLAPSTTVGVTGNTGTGGVGSVALPGTASISGNQATGSAGAVSPATVVAITGNAGTGAVGTLVSTKAKALSGNAATGSVGTVGDSRTVALTGNAATGSPGTVVVFNGNITIALTGNQATGQAGTVTVGSGAVVDETQRVRVRTLSWAEVVRKAWGKDWNKPDIVYEFSNRKFEERKRGGPYDPEDFED